VRTKTIAVALQTWVLQQRAYLDTVRASLDNVLSEVEQIDGVADVRLSSHKARLGEMEGGEWKPTNKERDDAQTTMESAWSGIALATGGTKAGGKQPFYDDMEVHQQSAETVMAHFVEALFPTRATKQKAEAARAAASGARGGGGGDSGGSSGDGGEGGSGGDGGDGGDVASASAGDVVASTASAGDRDEGGAGDEGGAAAGGVAKVTMADKLKVARKYMPTVKRWLKNFHGRRCFLCALNQQRGSQQEVAEGFDELANAMCYFLDMCIEGNDVRQACQMMIMVRLCVGWLAEEGCGCVGAGLRGVDDGGSMYMNEEGMVLCEEENDIVM
jgi:hypothetical protein